MFSQKGLFLVYYWELVLVNCHYLAYFKWTLNESITRFFLITIIILVHTAWHVLFGYKTYIIRSRKICQSKLIWCYSYLSSRGTLSNRCLVLCELQLYFLFQNILVKHLNVKNIKSKTGFFGVNILHICSIQFFNKKWKQNISRQYCS